MGKLPGDSFPGKTLPGRLPREQSHPSGQLYRGRRAERGFDRRRRDLYHHLGETPGSGRRLPDDRGRGLLQRGRGVPRAPKEPRDRRRVSGGCWGYLRLRGGRRRPAGPSRPRLKGLQRPGQRDRRRGRDIPGAGPSYDPPGNGRGPGRDGSDGSIGPEDRAGEPQGFDLAQEQQHHPDRRPDAEGKGQTVAGILSCGIDFSVRGPADKRSCLHGELYCAAALL